MRTPRATVCVRELVGFLLRRGDLERRGGDTGALAAGAQAHALSAREREAGYEAEVPLRLMVAGDPDLRVQGRADAVIATARGVTIEEIKSTAAPLEDLAAAREPDPVGALGLPGAPAGDRGGKLLDWAQAVCYAAMYQELHGTAGTRVRLRYVSSRTGETLLLHRAYGADALQAFLRTIAIRYGVWVRRAAEWERSRDRSMASLAFPFAHVRPGQEELMAAVEAAASQGERLFVQAPTGIGKTIGVLLPALRCLGQHAMRRVFYLTPRGTTAEAPLRALELLRSRGARIRVITLTAREKSCLSPGAGCAPAFCAHARGHHDRVLGALDDLLGREILDARAVEECARAHTVCPHELALDASQWCDLIIGDYNYVFDPRVALRRYLDPELAPPREQLFLIDEAHNLVDRAREMHSAELRSAVLAELAHAAEPGAPELAVAARALLEALPRVAEGCDEAAAGVESAVGTSTERPQVLDAPLEAFALAAEGWLSDGGGAPLAQDLAGPVFDTLFFRSILRRFDAAYALLAEARGDALAVKLACLDPSGAVREPMGQARASVLFSATLTPLEYYSSLLGGGEHAACLALPSPFPREHLRVLVDRSVSTRYRDRAGTLHRVAATVAAVAAARPGSYLAFVPSYDYLRALYGALREVAPGIRCMAQRPDMSERERREYLEDLTAFGRSAARASGGESLVGFAVLGGLFGEGVDLPGEGLVGAVVAGVGLPQVNPERELIRAYFEERYSQGFAYAYACPGIGRVLQAGGRVIRSETDRGVVVLVDERFASPPYRELLPPHWQTLTLVRGAREVTRELRAFWAEAEAAP